MPRSCLRTKRKIAALLFDLGPRLLTTRDVARLVKEGGVAALTEAERRADDATYQEIRCRSALNRVKGMPFNWTLNPYRGCTHGCHYCFARRYQTQLELGSGDEFSSLIFVKVNFVEVLRKELDHPDWTRELAALGTATDPYQPIEGHYKLSRGTLAGAGRWPHARRARDQGPDGRARHRRPAGSDEGRGRHRVYQRADASTRTRGGRSSPARRTRCSGCARSGRWSTPASTPAC